MLSKHDMVERYCCSDADPGDGGDVRRFDDSSPGLHAEAARRSRSQGKEAEFYNDDNHDLASLSVINFVVF